MVKDDPSEPEHLCRLFIGGLDYRTTDETLKAYFEQFGETVYVSVIRDSTTKLSRGFGFVTYAQSYMVDDAQKQRPHKVDGRTVDTKRAVPRDKISKGDSGISRRPFIGGLKKDVNEGDVTEPEHMCRLFVGGLDYGTTDESLKEYFEQFGETVYVVVIKDPITKISRGFGFVTFSRAFMLEDAQKQKPHEIDGRVVDTKIAVPRDEVNKKHSDSSVQKLFVGGLHEDIVEKELKEGFSEFGEVITVTILTEKDTDDTRFAYVEFEDYDAVDKACIKKEIKIGKNIVNVKRTQSHNKNRQQGGRMGGDMNQGGNGNSWGNNPNGGWGGGENNGWGNQANFGGPGGYNQGGYSSQSQWQGPPNSQGWPSGQGNQGWGSQPANYNAQGPNWNQGQSGPTDFGNNYGQSYGGGPMRNQNYAQPNQSMPYNTGANYSGPNGYTQGGYQAQGSWQGAAAPNQATQSWASQPANFNAQAPNWNQGQATAGQTDFGNNYGQSYGGGPARNQNYGGQQPNASMPYNNAGGASAAYNPSAMPVSDPSKQS